MDQSLWVMLSALSDEYSRFAWVLIIPVVASIYFYSRAKPKKRLSYHVVYKHFLGYETDELPDEVAVFYRGEAVARLDKALVLFWNSGSEALTGKDLVESDQFRFGGENFHLLASKVVRMSRSDNRIECRIEENPLGSTSIINFAYLNPGDGGIIEILYEPFPRLEYSDFDVVHKPALKGEINGTTSGIKDLSHRIPQEKSAMIWTVTTLLAIPIMTTGMGYLVLSLPESSDQQLLLSFLGLSFLVGAYTFGRQAHSRRRRFPKALSMEEFYG